jgi:hypothetical protein
VTNEIAAKFAFMKKIMLVKMLLPLPFILLSFEVAAQVSCGDPPRDIPIDVQREIKGDVEGKAQLFTKLLGDTQLTGKIQESKRDLYEKHQNVDKSQIDRYTIWVSCQNIMSDKKLSTSEKSQLFLEVYRQLTAFVPGAANEPPPTDYHMIVTENIGLQFKQQDKILPIRPDGEGQVVVAMRRQPFEILLNERTWKKTNDEYPALQVTVSGDSRLFELAKFDKRDDSGPFFWPGTGIADAEHGSGRLMAIDELSNTPFPHNYIIGARFNVDEGRSRGFYVSAILGESGANLLQTAKIVYMVFHLDRKDSALRDHFSFQKIDPFNVELVKIDFAN